MPARVKGLDASYYWAQDLERATRFYTDLFGEAPTMTMPDVFSEWVFPGGEAFGVYKGQEFRTSDGLMFAVDDIDAFVREARGRGIEIDEHIDGTPVCKMAFGKDSEGNGFILHHRLDGTVGPEPTTMGAAAAP